MAGPRVFECPSCGSPLSTNGDKAEIHCEYCGRTIIVPQELRDPPPPVAPQAPAPVITPELLLGAEIAEAIKAREARADQRQARRAQRRRGGGCGCSGLLALAVIAAALLLAQYGSPRTKTQAASVLAGMVGAKPTATPAAFSRPLKAGLPRTAHYANLDVTVTKADISNRAPGRTGQAPRYVADKAYAYVTTTIKNSLPDKSVYLTDRELRLQLADGSVYDDVNGWMDSIDQQSAKDADFAFQVPANATWQGARLVFGASNSEQTVLPLDGQAPAAPYPARLAVPAPVTVQGVIYKVASASLDVDYGGKRVDAGKRYLVLDFVINNQSSAPGGVVVSPNSFRVIAEDMPLAPLDAPSEAVAPNSSIQARVAFVVPAGVPRVDLQVGEVGKSTATLALNTKS